MEGKKWFEIIGPGKRNVTKIKEVGKIGQLAKKKKSLWSER